MKPLLLDEINASAPYEVYWHEKSRTYRFKRGCNLNCVKACS